MSYIVKPGCVVRDKDGVPYGPGCTVTREVWEANKQSVEEAAAREKATKPEPESEDDGTGF